jgi:hypothetical protein
LNSVSSDRKVTLILTKLAPFPGMKLSMKIGRDTQLCWVFINRLPRYVVVLMNSRFASKCASA